MFQKKPAPQMVWVLVVEYPTADMEAAVELMGECFYALAEVCIHIHPLFTEEKWPIITLEHAALFLDSHMTPSALH